MGTGEGGREVGSWGRQTKGRGRLRRRPLTGLALEPRKRGRLGIHRIRIPGSTDKGEGLRGGIK